MVYKLPEVVPSKNLVIEDPWGEHSIKIEKDLLLESFINEIINKTVPYIECHRKCGAQIICPYASDEVRCQIQQNAIKNFFKYAGTEVNLSDAKTLVKFTKVAIFYAKYAFHSFNLTCGANEEWLYKMWNKHYLRFPFHMACSVIEAGKKFIDLIREFLPDEFVQSVLLVEGDCEEIIFKEIFMKAYVSIPRFDQIRNLKGEGNFRRVELLLKELRNQNYKIHILADGDGQMTSTIKNLQQKGLVSANEYTLFEKSLEDAFSCDIVVKLFKQIMPDEYEDFVVKAAKIAWGSDNKTFSRELRKLLIESGVSAKGVEEIISSAKKEAAVLLAKELDNVLFNLPMRNQTESDVEILRVVYKLWLC